MHYSGIPSTTVGFWGRSGVITPRSPDSNTGAGSTEALSRVQAPERTNRHGFQPALAAHEVAENALVPFAPEDGVTHLPVQAALDSPSDAPSAPFMAQFIAQEIDPDIQGPEQHMNGARAYSTTRDSTMHIMSGNIGIDILV